MSHSDVTKELRWFKQVFEHSPDPAWIIEDHQFVACNDVALKQLGYASRDEVLNVHPSRYTKVRQAGDVDAFLQAERAMAVAREAGFHRDEWELVKADGSSLLAEATITKIMLEDRQVLCCVWRDIAEGRKAEQEVRDGAESLRFFADNVPAMTVSFDGNLRCVFANKRYADFFGFGTKEIIGKHLREIVREENYTEIENRFLHVLNGHPVSYQRIHQLANGEFLYLEIQLLPHLGDHGQVLGCFAVTTDITEHKLAEERIQHMADHDNLTGLPNRLLFNDRLHQTISFRKRDSRQFALLFLDLDKFKPVNDTLGHLAGDDLLKSVATRIRQQVRESDTVARLGGDEFALILPDVSQKADAAMVAEKIVLALAAPFHLESQNRRVQIGTSIGIAVYPEDATTSEGLVTVADGAMYRAKQLGGGTFSFSEPR